jgi:NAD(P)-dependent dehydrogenase (short-subunit alcohol dehydrogenase family)
MSIVLITGASQGVGLETALAFARAGHQVFAAMRRPPGSPILAELAASGKLQIHSVEMDVDSDASVRDAIEAKHQIDVFINNAGIQRSGSVEELPLGDVRSIMETNYFGALRCIQAVVEPMRVRRSGCIVNVSSGGGRYSHPPFAAYSASKWALEALSEALAGELKTFDVRVAIIEPVLIDTNMSRAIAATVPRSVYRQPQRFANFYGAGLKQPASPALVAKRILDVVTSGTWQLRHPVGPAAVPIMQFRARVTDEAWVDLNAADDQTWNTGLAKLNDLMRDSSEN